MNFSIPMLSLFSSVFVTGVAAQGINVTAIAAVNNASVLQCWALTTPPQVFAGAVNYPVGNFSNAFIGVIPPKTYIGIAHARQPQYVLGSVLIRSQIQHRNPVLVPVCARRKMLIC
jgi:hypothetical protein